MLHIEWHEYKSKTLARLDRSLDDAETSSAVAKLMAGLTVGTEALLAADLRESTPAQHASAYSNAQPAN